MTQRHKRGVLYLTKAYFLLAIMLLSATLNTEQALAVGASQQPECNETNSKTETATPEPSTNAAEEKGATKAPDVCYDKFLWLQNGIDYFAPCSSGSGGSNGSNNNKSTPTPDGKWVYPVGEGSTVSDHYGSRGGHHHGMDIAAPKGTPIYAAHSGKVVAAGPASGFGNWIIIESDDGKYSTVYGHMYDDGVDVSVGQHVNAGDKIGEVGSAGESSGPHLHFEVYEGSRLNGGKHTDPEPFLEGAGHSTNTEAPVAEKESSSQSTCCSTSEGTPTPLLAGSNNAEKVWNYLISQGLTPEQAAAVMGNLAWESGDPSFDKATSAEELSGGGGFGLAQWTGGRRTAIEKAATDRANNANLSRDEVLLDLGFQLEYLVQESKGRKQRHNDGNEWEGLKKQNSIEKANYYWMDNFERPRHLAEKERLDLAKDYYQRFTGKSPSDSMVSDSGGSSCSTSESEKKV